MPTRIVIFKKGDKSKEIQISTESFAHLREKVGTDWEIGVHNEGSTLVGTHTGKGTNLQDYEFIYENEESFRNFRPHPDNYFLKDLKIAYYQNKIAPSFPDLVEACSTPEMAEQLTIITARGQSPEEMLEGFIWLKEMGVIKHLPKLENLFPVSYKGFKGGGNADKPSDRKKQVIFDLIKKIEKLNPTAHFGFSDDDAKTIEIVKDFLKTHKTSLKIHLYFTGEGVKEKVLCK